jgi:phage baseplate assembly protein W
MGGSNITRRRIRNELIINNGKVRILYMAIYTDYRRPEYTVTDSAAINNAIKNILFTRKGSLPGKPTFGSNINQVLFNQMDYITRQLLEDQIEEALAQWETRIKVTSVDITEVEEYNKIVATINYVYTDTGLDVNESISVGFTQ